MNLFILSKTLLQPQKNEVAKPIVRLTIASVALGIMVMLLSLFITAGYKKVIREKVVEIGAHIRISSYEQNNSFDLKPISRTQEFVKKLQQNPKIFIVQFYASKVGILKMNEQVEGIVFKGIDTTFATKLFQKNIINGSQIYFSNDSISNAIFISQKTASKLKLQVGDKVASYFIQDPPRQRSFTVSGIYATGLPDFDNRFALVDLRHIQKLNDWDSTQVSGIEIFINNYDDLDEMCEWVSTNTPYDLKAETIKDLYPQILHWIDLFDTNVIVLLIITIFICLITMMSTFFIVVLEQTKTVGILKTMGMQNNKVFQLFLITATRLIFKGLLWGNALALTIGLLQYYFHLIPLDAETYYISYVPIEINDWVIIKFLGFKTSILSILLLNISVFFTCLFSLVLPALFISKRISPIDAIRFD